ncbi:MAG: NTP transferase domain-containing protein [Desulfurococcales archaeon]|nr:NTP transferase domain-containing protein [Desulfurococcales archaeon]MEB3789462.1 NTP transferase domain-containing protein [Desulfurococcales archaeon]
MEAAILLVGGKSKRFGSNKALKVIRGKTFFEHVYDALKRVVDNIYVSVSIHTPPAIYALTTVKGGILVSDEPLPCGGPPRAIISVHSRYKHNKYLVIGVDYPNISSEVLEKMHTYSLKSRISALTPVLYKGYPLIMLGILSSRVIEVLKKACYIKQSKTRLTDAYRAAYRAGYYGWTLFTDTPETFANVNTPDTLSKNMQRDLLANGERIHIVNTYYSRYLDCIGDGNIKCAVSLLEKEYELYKRKNLKLLARHVEQDIVWIRNEHL